MKGEAYEHLNPLTDGHDRTIEVSLSLMCHLLDQFVNEYDYKWRVIYGIERQLKEKPPDNDG